VEKLETVCIDTDVLIDFLRGKKETVEKIRKLEEEFDLATTTINIFELYFGAYKTNKERNVKAVNDLVERIEVFGLSKKSAEIAGRMMAVLERKGLEIGIRDTMVAGIAIENDVGLLTRNLKHYKRLEEFGLRLLDWS